MKRSVLIFLIVMSAILVQGHRENSYYLFGQFGTQKVCVEIDEYGEVCTARYFTPDDKYDHTLEGTISEDNWFELSSYLWDENKKERIKEDHLLVKEIETDIWEGTWKSKNKETQKVQLKRIVPDLLEHPYKAIIQQYHFTPYSAYRLMKTNIVKVKKERITKGAVILNVIDKTSGVESFRIVPNCRNRPQVDSINTRLIADHLHAIDTKYSCVYLNNKGDFQIDYKVNFLNESLISYTVTSHSSCYGGPTEGITDYQTLSIKSAKNVTLEDLFWFGNHQQPKLSEGEYQWTQYRYNEFTPKIIEIMATLFPDKFTDVNTANCNYLNPRIWNFPKWYLTKNGLHLISTFPLSSAQCKQVPQLTIPYGNLKSYETNNYRIK